MATPATESHVTVDGNGTAWVTGTRYKVLHLAGEHYHLGWTAEELLRQHTDLRPEEVYAALTWFYDHRVEMGAALHELSAVVENLRRDQSLTRDTLLQRRADNV